MIDLEIAKKEFENVSDEAELEVLRIKYLGSHGLLAILSQSIKTAPPHERATLGKTINSTKDALAQYLSNARAMLAEKIKTSHLPIDETMPGIVPEIARLHPTTETIRMIMSYFSRLGFEIYEGPEIETDSYNFDKLNVPKDHPARELQDTLYISEPEILLRTHTSSVETRCMTNEKPPIRIVVPGKCYRNENANASNNSIFYQFEGLLIDKGVTMAHVKGVLNGFVKHLYGDVKTRLRCKYYPQVEPGAGLDIECSICKGAGCITCKYRGLLEVIGAGMVHPNVLEKCGIDSKVYSGFAFGMGLDRLVMMRYGIEDIRLLYSGSLIYR